MKIVKFRYMYRFPDNWKEYGSMFFKSVSDKDVDSLLEELRDHLSDGCYFIAHQVGVREVFPNEWYDDPDEHHVWHEVVSLTEVSGEFETLATISFEDFIELVKKEDDLGWLYSWTPGIYRPRRDGEAVVMSYSRSPHV